jgi:hypothetical protein
MGRTHRVGWAGLSRCTAVAVVGVGLLCGGAAGCSGDDAVDEPDGAAFTTPFERAAEAAYRQAGRDREAETEEAVGRAVQDGTPRRPSWPARAGGPAPPRA